MSKIITKEDIQMFKCTHHIDNSLKKYGRVDQILTTPKRLKKHWVCSNCGDTGVDIVISK